MIVRRALLLFVPLAVVITALSGLAYLIGQQGQRTGANDPQVQLAEDAAARLDAGETPTAVVGTGPPVDVARSLAPFIVVYDPAGSALATDGQLDGAAPCRPERRPRRRSGERRQRRYLAAAGGRPGRHGHGAVEGRNGHRRTVSSPGRGARRRPDAACRACLDRDAGRHARRVRGGVLPVGRRPCPPVRRRTGANRIAAAPSATARARPLRRRRRLCRA